jgi:hypothetical protein
MGNESPQGFRSPLDENDTLFPISDAGAASAVDQYSGFDQDEDGLSGSGGQQARQPRLGSARLDQYELAMVCMVMFILYNHDDHPF